MKSSPALMLVIFIFSVVVIGVATAHSDPWGERHPVIRFEDSHFIIYLDEAYRDKEKKYLLRKFDSSLKKVSEKEVSKRLFQNLIFHSDEMIFEKDTWWNFTRFSRGKPSITAYRNDGSVVYIDLAWPVSIGLCHSFCIHGEYVTILCDEFDLENLPRPAGEDPFADESKKTQSPFQDEGKSMAYTFSLKNGALLGMVVLGLPERIYSFPRASEIVVSDGIAYIAWARKKASSTNSRGELLISSWKLGTPLVNHTIVDPDVTWNTSISLCAAEDQVVAAYHDQDAEGALAKIEIRVIPKIKGK